MRYILVILMVLGFSHASARPITNVEKAALEASINDFTEALAENDMMRVFRIAPDRVLQSLAAQANMPLDAFLNLVKEQLDQVMTRAEFRHFEFEMERVDLTDAIHSDGTVIAYGIIPSTFEMVVDGAVFRQETQFLVLSENGVWYIIRFAEVQQILLLQQAYPFFDDLETARSSVTRLSE
ncbi:MAG: hypothetical protein GQ535_16850 [Rhodobacteraceae bacterium]|nr:hypothetical protein [Paracoccaceae bacterium]